MLPCTALGLPRLGPEGNISTAVIERKTRTLKGKFCLR